MRAYYSQPIRNFLSENISYILGKLTTQHHFDVSQNQNMAWQEQIQLLQNHLSALDAGEIIFEYEIPRIGKRIDNVVLYNDIVFLLEFKTGTSNVNVADLDQVMDYALDLKNFHQASHNVIIVPILIAVGESQKDLPEFKRHKDGVYQAFSCHIDQLLTCFQQISKVHTYLEKLDSTAWINSVYSPTPTIIEAARALYQGHGVANISRSDAGAINLTLTANDVGKIIDECKQEKKKAICFITGVPGAGKTLAGLNIVNARQNYKEEELATFLSGNGPLVSVLREALARDKVLVSGGSKKDAEREVNSFIQNIHHFRDDALKTPKAPAEHVVLFDEAQRAWDKDTASKFMSQKRGITNFAQSEPEFLISIMDRHQDWAVIVCLVGNGQEINTGEAGLAEWFNALKSFPEWEIYTPKLLPEITQVEKIIIREHLHLSVSLRSFRSECLADFVSATLDGETDTAKNIFLKLSEQYPIVMTRDLNKARWWLREKSRGTELAGIIASSGARRLKKEGIYVQRDFNVEAWFLNNQTDVRSANFLEEVATEFDCQGLELDWACIAWDLDLKRVNNQWEYKNFIGTKWNSIKKDDARKFKKNAYRVLLTRARQGMILYIPIGDDLDMTRPTKEYDLIYSYLSEIGIMEV